MEELVRLRANPETLATLVKKATLTRTAEEPYYEGILVAATEEGLETPASTRDGSPSIYTSYASAHFESLEVTTEATAVIRTEPTLRWLEWFDDETVTVVFEGNPTAELATVAEIRGSDFSMRASPIDKGISMAGVMLDLPEKFADDGTFAPGGEPAPTCIETDVRTLERLVDAAAIIHDRSVPLVVEDGSFRLDLSGDFMTASGEFPVEAIHGEDCHEWVGRELGEVARILDGTVSVYVVPDGPVAVVDESPTAVRRYVIEEQI